MAEIELLEKRRTQILAIFESEDCFDAAPELIDELAEIETALQKRYAPCTPPIAAERDRQSEIHFARNGY